MVNSRESAGPCSAGLTQNCFKQHPAFAKQAFAYRLLHTITPKPLARKLPEILRDALVAGGVIVPPGLTLPPGVVVPPGSVLPVEPVPVGEVPGGALQPPSNMLPPDIPVGGVIPPLYTAPWSPGPGQGAGVITRPDTTTTLTIRAGVGDGVVYRTDPTWDAARNTSSGESENHTFHEYELAMAARYTGGQYSVFRSFFIFSLAGIPEGSIITDAVFVLAGTYYSQSSVCVQRSSHFEPLTTGAFNDFTGNLFGSVAWDNGTYPGYVHNEIPFNATGLTYLNNSIGGQAKLCAREYTHDYLDATPVGINMNGCFYASTPTEDARPALVVKY